MTPEQIEELERLDKERTQGEWAWNMTEISRGAKKGKAIHAGLGCTPRASIIRTNWNEFDGGLWEAWVSVTPENAAFIASLANAAPALLADWRRMREVLETAARKFREYEVLHEAKRH